MIFSNARLILPDGIRDGLEVVVENGKIAEIRERSAADSVNLAGNYLAPGFIDLHIHGALGRDTMEATPESFRAICDYHATGGTTSLLLTTVTAPIAEIVERVTRGARAGRRHQTDRRRACRRAVHFQGARRRATRGVHSRSGCSTWSINCLEFADVIKIVTLAPELPGALALISRLREHNIVVSGGHSDASDIEARAGFEYGMRHVTHTFNAMSSARRQGTLSRGRFARIRPERTGNPVRAHRRRPSRFADPDEDALSGQGSGRNCPRDGCHGRRRIAGGQGIFARGASLCSRGWRLPAGGSLGAGRQRGAHDRSGAR